MLEFLIFLLSVPLAYFFWRRYRLMNLRSELGIPGPKANFFFGNVFDLKEYFKKYNETNAVFLEWRKQYGNIYGVYFGPSLYVVVNDLEMAREVLIKQNTYFIDRPYIPFMGYKPLSNMLVNLRGDHWKQIRNLLTPTFTTAKLKQMGDAANDKIETFMKRMDEYSKDGKVFNMQKPLQALTLDVIAKCAFAMDVKSQTDKNDVFLQNTEIFFQYLSMQKSVWVLLCFLFPEFNTIISYFRSLSKTGIAEKWIFNNLRKVIEARKRILNTVKSVDVLQVLLEQNETSTENENKKGSVMNESANYISDDILEANIFVFLVAGYETTSTALSFMIWLLAKYQDVQKQLQSEIDEKLASKEQVNYETVRNMPYLDAVFKETLRCYPPVTGFLMRDCVKDCNIHGINFIEGMKVMILPRVIHGDPNIWSDPDHFNPDRFLNSKDYNPMSWLPFGAGPRNCIGMRFADMEAKLVAFKLLSKYNIELGDGSEDQLTVQEADFTMRPTNGVVIKLTKRG